ncbi:MAG: hypothetical protein Q9226_004854 [Calogaya cf. arnoldii]
MAPSKQKAVKDGKKKKGKKLSDGLQPEFEEHPGLNPKPKSANGVAQEWEDAIKFLQHQAHSAPPKPALPKQLLTLVGEFLTSYGFDKTYRIYQVQCNARSKIDDWDSSLGEKLPKAFPDLVQLYEHGLQTYEEKQPMDKTSNSDGEDIQASDINKSAKARPGETVQKGKEEAAKAETVQTSNSGSDEDSDSDIDMKNVSAAPKSAEGPTKSKPLVSSSYSYSTSESDADDENETTVLGVSSRKPTTFEITNPLKRKAPPSPSSSSDSSASEAEPAPKKAKKDLVKPEKTVGATNALSKCIESKRRPPKSPLSETSSSSSGSDSISGSAEDGPEKGVKPSSTDTLPYTTKLPSSSDSDSTSSDSASEKPNNTGAKDTLPYTTNLPSSSDSESTSSDSDSGQPSNVGTKDNPPSTTKIPSSSESDTTSSDSDSESDVKVAKSGKPPYESKISSDSSVTLVPTPTTSTSQDNTKDANRSTTSSSSSSSSSSSDSEAESGLTSKKPVATDTTTNRKKRKASASPDAPIESTTVNVHEELNPARGIVTSIKTTTSRKEAKPRAVPFSRIAPNTPIPAALASNAYQPYDYAERAHQDLIVTKGKGFTKEKNKKKRGSYRGGVIDVGPGRAIRFDD